MIAHQAQPSLFLRVLTKLDHQALLPHVLQVKLAHGKIMLVTIVHQAHTKINHLQHLVNHVQQTIVAHLLKLLLQ